MSRSYKEPFVGCANSEKKDKQMNNRKRRRISKEIDWENDEDYPIINQCGNKWDMAKDGGWWSDKEKDKRK